MGLIATLEKLARWSLRKKGFVSRNLTTSTGTVHGYDAVGTGSLPTIAVLHGVGSNAAPYARVLLRLRTVARRVVILETPGHGLSDTPSSGLAPEVVFDGVAEALLKLLDEPAVLFGNSLGGGIALRFSVDYPDQVRGLVLSSPAGAPLPEHEWEPFLSNFKLESTAEAREFLSKLYHRPPWYWRLLVGDLKQNLNRPELQQFFNSVDEEHFMTPDEISALQMPILLLWGAAEELMRDSQLAWFENHLPSHAIVERPAGFAHSPYLEYPDRLAERIHRFVRNIDSFQARSSSNRDQP